MDNNHRSDGIGTHDELVAALRAVDGLRDVGKQHPNFHLRSRPFLHFHQDKSTGRVYADVRFGSGDFTPVWASTPAERRDLIDRVRRHVVRLERTRKERPERRPR